MAVRINLSRTESRLFCGSKWWGDPDMPKDMQYPMMKDETGEDYPLTFYCQVDCNDIAPFDTEGLLPHDGMLYFFAAVDEYLGFDSPVHNGVGRWEKKTVVVKYAKTINMETFESYIMVDEDDETLTSPALKMEFEHCDDSAGGLKLLGSPSGDDAKENMADFVNILQIEGGDGLLQDLAFPESGILNVMLKASDLGFRNWSRATGYLSLR